MVVAALGLLSLFIFPMWRITLLAPQYPDGVTMYIYINKLGGESSGTLQNVNILNHYVGMKKIDPDAIPELSYFPYIVIGLVVLGLGAAWSNNPRLFLAWGVLMVLVSMVGLYDFYLWEYDYGHNLSDTAPIKIEGQSYQPPLIGSAKILNFIAVSMPHTSGWLAGICILLSFVAAWVSFKKKKNESTEKYKLDTVPNLVD
ncbi:MAG: hypothetical protein DHS20C18_45820 [Saprospiraceae bacterium]|nr:MAG: hypothetical protein DHS20C18_45820 [Saprospiraceae bacterium]